MCDTSEKGNHTNWLNIYRDPGNKIPTKCISSGNIFGRIQAMHQVARAK